MSAPSEYSPLDATDRAILQLLQRDARNQTHVEIADLVGVSDGTVRNRITHLEDRGVIEGYVPVVNYERAGYQLQIQLTCTATVPDRAGLAEDALQVEGVIEVDELMTGRGNVQVTAVAPQKDDVTGIAEELDELGLDIEEEYLVRRHFFRPFNHFGSEDVRAGDEDEATHEV